MTRIHGIMATLAFVSGSLIACTANAQDNAQKSKAGHATRALNITYFFPDASAKEVEESVASQVRQSLRSVEKGISICTAGKAEFYIMPHHGLSRVQLRQLLKEKGVQQRLPKGCLAPFIAFASPYTGWPQTPVQKDFTTYWPQEYKFDRFIESRGGVIQRDPDHPEQPIIGMDFTRPRFDVRLRPTIYSSAPPFSSNNVDYLMPRRPGPFHVTPVAKLNDADMERLKGMTQLRSLKLDNTNVTDAGLKHVAGLTQLQTLTLPRTKVTGASLQYLKGLTQLQDLNLVLPEVTDAALVHIKGLTQLRSLNLSSTEVTDAGLMHIKGLTQLRSLDLHNAKVNGKGLVHIKGLTQLQYLDLCCPGLTDAALEHLKGNVRLEQLFLNCTEVTDAGLVHIGELEKLRELRLIKTKVTDAGLEYLKGLTQLRDLSLEGTQVTGTGFEHLKDFEQLRYLDLSFTELNGKGLEHLKGMTQLQILVLRSTRLPQGGFELLKEFKHLRYLSLGRIDKSEAYLPELKMALPNCNTITRN